MKLKNKTFPCLIIHQLLTSPRKREHFIEVMNSLGLVIELHKTKNTFSIIAREE